MSEFARFVERIKAEVTTVAGKLPPTLKMSPSLPAEPLGCNESIDHEGWCYRGLAPGIYHAWPNNQDFYETILDAWLDCMDTPARRMVGCFSDGLGPIFTGTLIVTGQLPNSDDRVTVFADSIVYPFRFDDSRHDKQFCPVLSLSSPDPVESFLKELLHAYLYNGQLTQHEYDLTTADMYSEFRPGPPNSDPGRTEFVGEIYTTPLKSQNQGLRIWIADGEIVAFNHPRFPVFPDMLKEEYRWPAVLKRKNRCTTSRHL